MASGPGSDFGKNCNCPSSPELAFYLYQRRKPANKQRSHITAHLAQCDFCAAEFQLLTRFTPAAQHAECPPMPANLRALAESLFANGSAQISVLRWPNHA